MAALIVCSENINAMWKTHN